LLLLLLLSLLLLLLLQRLRAWWWRKLLFCCAWLCLCLRHARACVHTDMLRTGKGGRRNRTMLRVCVARDTTCDFMPLECCTEMDLARMPPLAEAGEFDCARCGGFVPLAEADIDEIYYRCAACEDAVVCATCADLVCMQCNADQEITHTPAERQVCTIPSTSSSDLQELAFYAQLYTQYGPGPPLVIAVVETAGRIFTHDVYESANVDDWMVIDGCWTLGQRRAPDILNAWLPDLPDELGAHILRLCRGEPRPVCRTPTPSPTPSPDPAEMCDLCQTFIPDVGGWLMCECGMTCCDECALQNPFDADDFHRYCEQCVPQPESSSESSSEESSDESSDESSA